ncbi:MAG: DUF4097 family beta strand repeat-containing protein [Bryobacteraceae bacterium]|jgi:DUF4097 and DUF4098 domain-containing protein YvlB
MNRILMVALCLAPLALAQEKTLSCDEDSRWSERGHYCEMREVAVPAGGRLDVDAGVNGGISIKGANRNDILVRSQVQAYQDDQADSRRIVAEVHVEAGAGRVRASGPTTEKHGWSVSYEIFVPASTDLVLRTHNGGISITGVQGHTQFEAVNGGVSLKQMAGLVEGHTANGGLNVELAADHWDGDHCDVSTTNGGVTIRVPSSYSAHLETGTVNGGIRVDFPVTVQGEVDRHLAVDLGSGGNLVRATTTNGGVRVERM